MTILEWIVGAWFCAVILVAVWNVANKQAPHEDWSKYEDRREEEE